MMTVTRLLISVKMLLLIYKKLSISITFVINSIFEAEGKRYLISQKQNQKTWPYVLKILFVLSLFFYNHFQLRSIIILFLMSEYQIIKQNQINTLWDKAMGTPLLQPIPYVIVQKLSRYFKNPSIQLSFQQDLIFKLSVETEVIIRLKCWVLVHLILLGSNNQETLAVIEIAIENRQQKTKLNSDNQHYETLDRYLQDQVEMPFVLFLKKLMIWKAISQSDYKNDLTCIGFSELNKIKEIMQLKKIFHNYGCYYATHQYALNLFQACLLNIKSLWMSVCAKIKIITQKSIKINRIQQSQYLLIKQAEMVQDLLIEFVYGDKLVLRVSKGLLVKQVNLLRTEIQLLENQRKRTSSMQTTWDIIMQKKNRQLSARTVDSNRQTSQNPRNQQKLNTEQQIEIMDTINQLQMLLSFQISNI